MARRAPRNPGTMEMCARKVMHANYRAARRAAAKRRKGRQWVVVPYRCDVCGHWHTGRASRSPGFVLDSLEHMKED